MTTSTFTIHPNAKQLPASTRMALAEAALVISGAIGPRLTTPGAQWDKLAHTVCSLRDLREPDEFTSNYTTRAKAWVVYAQLVNALL